MALSANTIRKYELGDVNGLPVKASSVIYQGSAVGVTAGYARALVAGDTFVGFAEEKADNTSGSDGDIIVSVREIGKSEILVSSAAITSLGADVYASDDGTFTLTVGSNTKVGKIARHITGNLCVVAFRAASRG